MISFSTRFPTVFSSPDSKLAEVKNMSEFVTLDVELNGIEPSASSMPFMRDGANPRGKREEPVFRGPENTPAHRRENGFADLPPRSKRRPAPIIAALALAACSGGVGTPTAPSREMQALTAAGFKNIELLGWAPFTCAKDDDFCTGFVATTRERSHRTPASGDQPRSPLRSARWPRGPRSRGRALLVADAQGARAAQA